MNQNSILSPPSPHLLHDLYTYPFESCSFLKCPPKRELQPKIIIKPIWYAEGV
jgi:hypothetical protein